MKQVKTIGLITVTAIVLLSCGGSKKDGTAELNDLKAKLEKEKKERADNETSIKKLEEDILKLDTNAANAAKIKLVSVMPVVKQNFEHFIDLQGRVDAENISYIAPRSTGMSAGGVVKAVFVKQGQFVKKGQLLLKLDDAIIRQSITASVKQMEVTKTQLSFAKNVYQRQKNLWDQGIGTEVQLLQSKSNAEQLENALKAAEEMVLTSKEQLNTTNVYSDVNGVADQVNIRVGETFTGVTMQGIQQIKIVNKSSLKVVTNVPENYLTRMHTGTPVLINIPDAGKQNLASSISLISQSVDPTMRGFTAEAKIPADGNLKPNQTAIMRIKDYSAANAVVIPVNMVQTDESGKYVYVMSKSSNGKNTAHKVNILAGEVYGNNIEIKGGLAGGEQLITEGYQSLYEGQAISTGTK
jgi:membrane fusion protein (multidrug efflux system)